MLIYNYLCLTKIPIIENLVITVPGNDQSRILMVHKLKNRLAENDIKLNAIMKMKKKLRMDNGPSKRLLKIEEDCQQDQAQNKHKIPKKIDKEELLEKKWFGPQGSNLQNIKELLKNYNNYVNKVKFKKKKPTKSSRFDINDTFQDLKESNISDSQKAIRIHSKYQYKN